MMRLSVIVVGIHSGVIDLGLSPDKRVVTIELTPEQEAAIGLRPIGRMNGGDVREHIDQAILEEVSNG